jgi:Domain of unknown function (DUF4386)
MTLTTNARVAGCGLLLYIAVGVTQLVVFGGTTAGDSAAARLANMARHAGDVRVDVVLGLLTCVIALTVGVALYAITREADADLAMLALLCRVGEGLIGAVPIPVTLSLLSQASTRGASATDPAAATDALGTLVLTAGGLNPIVAAIFFAVGSTIFSWLLVRGRIVPSRLAWLGFAASLLLVVGLPLRLTRVLTGPVTMLMWVPMAAFEIPLGVWLLVKGVATPGRIGIASDAGQDRPRV